MNKVGNEENAHVLTQPAQLDPDPSPTHIRIMLPLEGKKLSYPGVRHRPLLPHASEIFFPTIYGSQSVIGYERGLGGR